MLSEILDHLQALKLPAEKEKEVYENILRSILDELDDEIRNDSNQTEQNKKFLNLIEHIIRTYRNSQSYSLEEYIDWNPNKYL